MALGVSAIAEPWVRRHLARRARHGKEDPARLPERFGIASVARPAGRLIWFHAASVGESVSLLSLIGGLAKAEPAPQVLLTTGTRSSADLMRRRLPDGVIHQFAPVDTRAAVRRFLRHWAPDMAVWTESELWPRLVVETNRLGCPMLLINARISDRSAARLRRFPHYSAALLVRFDTILAQDPPGAARLISLGARADTVEVAGSLKDTADPLPHDVDALARLKKQLAGRPVWLAASTHDGEEEIAATAHRRARRRFPGLLLIIAPRHPERGPSIAERLRTEGWAVAMRSAGEEPNRETEIYLADTLGEMGLWYRLATVSFLGGSLTDAGGHNPFEPALLGSAILHGPHVQNFAMTYARFQAAGAAVPVPDANSLAAKVIESLPPDRAAALANAAWSVSSEGVDVIRHVRRVILDHLPAPRT